MPAILVVVIGAASAWYIWPSPTEFPMDDAYIHMTYARNLVEDGKLFFNDASERGVGTSSILWVMLLAGGYKVGLSLDMVAKLLGTASLAAVSVGLYLLLRPFWHPLAAFGGALLVGLSGNMLWFALNGMETTLFLALGVLALLAYRKERWGWLGIALGLLALTRPEGLALAAAIGGIEIVRQRGIRRGILISGLICLAVCGPWFGYLLWRSGNILPTSGMSKHLTSVISLEYGLEKSGKLAVLGRIPGLVYIILWVVYLLMFTLGGMALPAPTLLIGNMGGAAAYSVSLWSIPAWGVVIGLIFAAGRRLRPFQKIGQWIQDEARRPMFALLAWCVLHNLCYMIFLPVPGTASRYGAINHILLWLALIHGLLSFLRHRRLSVGLAIGLVIIAAVNTVYWNGVYDANLDHMKNVRIAAAHYIRDHIPVEDLCAASDVGALRYHSGRPILDLGGLIDPDAHTWFSQGASDRYLVKNGVDWLALPGQIGATEEGWLDIAEILGLTTSHLFRMDAVAVFEIDYERWLQGYLPTTNYQATVVVYRLVPENR